MTVLRDSPSLLMVLVYSLVCLTLLASLLVTVEMDLEGVESADIIDPNFKFPVAKQ